MLLALAGAGAQAAPVWQQSNELSSTLDANFSYTTSGNTATVTYLAQTATNTGSSAGHLGLYIGWNWLYLGNADAPLTWDNGANAFTTPSFGSGPASLRITRPSLADQSLRLGDVAGDTWIGVPYAPGVETPIATAADWVVPLFDFGVIGAGASVTYDIAFEFTFNSLADRDSNWSFFTSAQGVKLVPEPSGTALFGIALLAAAAGRRRRRAET